ncbi:hypothetical protein CPB85DRAFT_1320314 [Mucidula mucida]|nr:hypothetical protein CPB85DRAFT_1320314 [Mucidula mucida]
MPFLDIYLFSFSVSVQSPILGTLLGFVAGLMAASVIWFTLYTTQSRVHQVGMTLNEIEWDIRRAEELRATFQKRAALASLNDLRSRQQIPAHSIRVVISAGHECWLPTIISTTFLCPYSSMPASGRKVQEP